MPIIDAYPYTPDEWANIVDAMVEIKEAEQIYISRRGGLKDKGTFLGIKVLYCHETTGYQCLSVYFARLVSIMTSCTIQAAKKFITIEEAESISLFEKVYKLQTK